MTVGDLIQKLEEVPSEWLVGVEMRSDFEVMTDDPFYQAEVFLHDGGRLEKVYPEQFKNMITPQTLRAIIFVGN